MDSCWKHQQSNSDELDGAIRNPIQQGEVVGRALRGSVCSLGSERTDCKPIDVSVNRLFQTFNVYFLFFSNFLILLEGLPFSSLYK